MKKKFNVIDILIILFIVLAVGGGTFAVRSFMNRGSGETKQIVLEVTDKEENFCKVIKKDDEVYDGVENVKLGKVVDFEIKDAEIDSISSIDGTIKHTKIPERYDILLTIEIPQETDVQVGKQLWIESSMYKCSGYILEVNDGGREAENR